MFLTTVSLLYFTNAVGSAVLDPALFLSPNPPLKDTTIDLSPAEKWSKAVVKKVDHTTAKPSTLEIEKKPSKKDSEEMEGAETFWPFVRSAEVKVSGVHIPLTFSVSGTYDKFSSPSGVISSSYLKVPGATSVFGNYGKSGLAGSGYGRYAAGYPSVKIYAGNNQPAWSGWGNGKWGHYGKG